MVIPVLLSQYSNPRTDFSLAVDQLIPQKGSGPSIWGDDSSRASSSAFSFPLINKYQ